MATNNVNIVFHFSSPHLFARFVGAIPREALLTPLRRSKELFVRYFRGYRLSDTTPTLQAIQMAYGKEITERRNEALIGHLCSRWLLAHPELSTAGLRSLGIETELPDLKSWLPRVHEALAA